MKKVTLPVAMLVIGLTSNLLNAQSGWTLQTNPLGAGDSAMIGKVQFVSANEGWISAGNGKLLHTTNGGINWLIVNPEPIDTLFSWSDPAVGMSFINPSTGWIIRTKGSFSQWNGAVVYKTTNGGADWSKQTLTDWKMGLSVQFIDANNGWITVWNVSGTNITGGALLRTTNGGTNWNLAYNFGPGKVGIPFFVNSLTGWMIAGGVDSLSLIKKTIDAGLNWTTQWGTTTQDIFNAIHFSDVNNGWAVGRNGLILKTTNGGNSWANTGITSAYNSNTVFFLNANTGWIGTARDREAPKVLYTTNGGSSWTIQNTPVSGPRDDIFSIFFWDINNGWLVADDRICRYSSVTGIKDNVNLPIDFSLFQNYPNPFNPATTISFNLPSKSIVSLKVFDALGREVSILVSEELPRGTYSRQWDAAGLPSGVYFYRLQAGLFTETKKLLLLR
ncbi:MAG: T9SS type A sorting domain-containing protein [Ignavibacterium sp.]|nr:T9SS type A sorting domain-containing protein [Ignavibacterium sp.]